MRVLPLGDSDVSREEFGAKAYVLSRLLATDEVRVPRGYAVRILTDDLSDGNLRRSLNDMASDLRRDGRHMIVRSSASIEDAAYPLFPGRFASRRNLGSAEDLLAGVKFCLGATERNRVVEYVNAHDLGASSVRMNLIVQEQITAEYAGVTFTRAPRPFHNYASLVELVANDAAGLLAGETNGALVGVNPGPPRDDYVQIAGARYDLDAMTSLLPEVFSTCRSVERLLGESQDIEWVWADGQVYVVQARPNRLLLREPSETPPTRGPLIAGRPHPVLELSDELGQKAATQQYFGHRGIGAPNGVVIPPAADCDVVTDRLKDRSVGVGGSVIRFSYREDAGLPVEFVPRDVDLAEAYLSCRPHAECAGIVSDYVVAEHAFEAYVGVEHIIVEHISGNWEPQSTLIPDLTLWYANEVQVWRSVDLRAATYELPASGWLDAALTHNESQTVTADLIAWIDDLWKHLRGIRADLKPHLPINVHFIRARENWHFLNIRPTRDLVVRKSARTPDARFKPRRCFFIAGVDDLDGWDGEAPILVSHHVDTEETGHLALLCHALRAAHVDTALTTFGALSHPALVMREFGIEPRPLYDTHELVLRRAAVTVP